MLMARAGWGASIGGGEAGFGSWAWADAATSTTATQAERRTGRRARMWTRAAYAALVPRAGPTRVASSRAATVRIPGNSSRAQGISPGFLSFPWRVPPGRSPGACVAYMSGLDGGSGITTLGLHASDRPSVAPGHGDAR